MRLLLYLFPLFLLSCGNEQSTTFSYEHFTTEGDSLILKIYADKEILKGESFRKHSNIICYLKGNVDSDGAISFSEYFDEGECYGVFSGKFNMEGDKHAFINGIWQKPDPDKPKHTVKLFKIEQSAFAEATKRLLPQPTAPNASGSSAKQSPRTRLSKFFKDVANVVESSVSKPDKKVATKPTKTKENPKNQRGTKRIGLDPDLD